MKPPDILNVYTITPDGRACVELRDIRAVSQLPDGSTDYAAHVTYYRDGETAGKGLWAREGFVAPVPTLASDAASSDAAILRLENEVRKALSQYT